MLMLAGIRDILIITTPHEQESFIRLLGDGKPFGVNFQYAVQPEPKGLAQAFLIGREFVGNDKVALILGDNIYYGDGLVFQLRRAVERELGATVFAYKVGDPQRYGVVDFNDKGEAIGLEEKPENPRSNYAVTGLYFYDNRVLDVAAELKPSARGELEITDVNLNYLAEKTLYVEIMGRGIAWLDTGTHESLLQASHFIQVIEERQALKVSCLEEIAYRLGYIGTEELREVAMSMKNNGYGQYLQRLLEDERVTFTQKPAT